MSEERDNTRAAGDGQEWDETPYRRPPPPARVVRRVWDRIESVALRPGAEERFLAAARAGRELRLLRAAAKSMDQSESGAIGAHLARARMACGVDLEPVAEYIGAATGHLRLLESSDSALSRFKPAALAALIDLLELPFRIASVWVRAGLGPWIASAGLRSAAIVPTGRRADALDGHMEAVAAALRGRGRADLLADAGEG